MELKKKEIQRKKPHFRKYNTMCFQLIWARFTENVNKGRLINNERKTIEDVSNAKKRW